MIIHIQKLDSFVTVDGVSKTVDLNGLPSEVETISYNTLTGVGVLSTGTGDSYFGKTIFDNFYAQYVQIWRAMSGSPVRTLAEVKADKVAQINSTRDTLEQSGFPYLETEFDSNPVSVQRIAISVQAAQAALAAEQELTLDWTDKFNNVVPLTALEMVSMPVALAGYANSLHQHAKEKKVLINAATTIEEVEAITW